MKSTLWVVCLVAGGCAAPLDAAGNGGARGGTGGNPGFEADCDNGPLAAPLANCQPAPLTSAGNAYTDCVNRINQLRWECQCLPPLQHWTEGEACADQHAEYDSTRGAHAGFSQDICSPRGWAQNECPGWTSVDRVITGCLQAMWNEGPGEPFSEHGHYINMSNPQYTRVACGFYETPGGELWSVQNFQ